MRSVAGPKAAGLVLGRASVSVEDRVVGVRLDVLLEILGSLERLAAKVALVRLQGHMDTDVRCDVITLDGSGSARIPLARQVEVVGALPANMAFTDVIVECLGCGEALVTRVPLAHETIILVVARRRRRCCGCRRSRRIAVGARRTRRVLV